MTGDIRAPYVTAYTCEEIDLNLVITSCDDAMGGMHLAYADRRREDWFLDVLWARQETHRRGRPLFSDLNVSRQRECMLGHLCQVCRGSAVHNGRIWWVFPHEAPSVNLRTAKPPTCPGCIRESVQSCKHLQNGARAYTSDSFCEPYGVIGDVYSPTAVRRHEIALTEFYQLERTLALALIVNVRNLRPEPIP